MKKKTVRRVAKKSSKRVVHHRATKSISTYGNWDKDRSMMIMLAAGTIILVVVGMFMAGWL